MKKLSQVGKIALYVLAGWVMLGMGTFTMVGSKKLIEMSQVAAAQNYVGQVNQAMGKMREELSALKNDDVNKVLNKYLPEKK